MTIKVRCSWCGKEFEKYPSRAKRNDHHFCCPEHYNLWKSEKFSGKGNPNYKDGRSLKKADPIDYGAESLDPLWLSWFAGLVDGEGSFVLGVSLRKVGERGNRSKCPIFTFSPVLAIKLHSRENEWLDMIHETLGFGKRYDQNNRETTSWQTVARWETFKACCLLWPHLYLKKPQALVLAKSSLLLEYYSSTGTYNLDSTKLWRLLQIRKNLNYRAPTNPNRRDYTKKQVEEVVRKQINAGLSSRKSPPRINSDLLTMVPPPLTELANQLYKVQRDYASS